MKSPDPSMLTKEQKFLLAQLVRENKEVLLKKFGTHGVTKKTKENVWEAIRQELLDIGADLPNLKTLRDTEWNNLRRATMKRFAENQKNGTSLTEIDDIILDAVGRDYVQTKLDENDSADHDTPPVDVTVVECDPIVIHSDDVSDETQTDTPSTSASHDANKTVRTKAFMGLLDDQIVPPSNSKLSSCRKRKLFDTSLEMLNSGFEKNILQYNDEVNHDKVELEKEFLRQEIQLRKAQILESQARTKYYEAATKALLEKKVPVNLQQLS